MSNRHLARTIAMQTLYEWDFHGNREPWEALGDAVRRNAEECSLSDDDREFADAILAGVFAHRPEVDRLITHYAPEWPLEQITIVDRNILRIGVFELVFSETIPSKVAIDEAIEIAKHFGGESSGRFVNGVLGAIYRDRTKRGDMKPIDAELRKKQEEKERAAAQDSSGATSD